MRHFKVQALPLEGHKYYRRAGFAWPRGEGYQLVEVVADKDPRAGKIDDGFLCITREQYDILAKDRFLRVVPDGDPLTLFEHAGEVKALRQQLEERDDQIAERDAKIAKLEAELSKAAKNSGSAKLDARVKELEGENTALKAKLAEGRPA